MTDLFGNVIVDDKPRTIPTNQPTAITLFLFATWYSPHGQWKIWHDFSYTERGACEAKAMQVLEKIRGHTHYCVLEINLPGVIL